MQSGIKSTAFILSLIGGVLMIVNSVLSVILLTSYGGSFGFLGGMMGGFAGMMGSWGLPFGLTAGFMLVGIVAGIIVLISAIMLNSQPAEHLAWGVVILIFSIISFLGMGGFVIGAILGIAGGALAIS